MKLTTHLSTPWGWGWKTELALLTDLQRTVYPYKWLPISCRSGADQWSSPIRDRRSTTEPPNQLPELTAQVNGPSWQLLVSITRQHDPSTRAVNSGSGNRALDILMQSDGSMLAFRLTGHWTLQGKIYRETEEKFYHLNPISKTDVEICGMWIKA